MTKDVAYKVTSMEESEQVQRILFAQGCRWIFPANCEKVFHPTCIQPPYALFVRNKSITWGDTRFADCPVFDAAVILQPLVKKPFSPHLKKFLITSEDMNTVVQGALFALGYRWGGWGGADKVKTVPYAFPNAIFVDDNTTLTYSEGSFAYTDTEYEFGDVDELREAARKATVVTIEQMFDSLVVSGDIIENEGTEYPPAVLEEVVSLPIGVDKVTTVEAGQEFLQYIVDSGDGKWADGGKKSSSALDTNPKRQFGMKNIPLQMWPALASAYGSLSLFNGGGKYGYGNYKATPVEASIYIAAAKRHLAAWEEGEEFDPKDGCPNLGGVLANVAILLEARAVGTLIDDRQIQGGYLKEREALGKIAEALSILHADKNPRHYTLADSKP